MSNKGNDNSNQNVEITIENLLQKGIDLAKRNMFREALAVFETILDIYPDEPRTLFNLAVTKDLLGQREASLTLLHRSIESDPSFANPHYYLGQLYLKAKRYLEAFQAFRAAITRDVEFMPAYEGVKIAASSLGLPVFASKADIVFYTGGHPFHGKTMEEKGLGGSESALIYIARALVSHGNRVHVFCNCDCPGDYNGVRYDDLVDFHIYRNLCQLPVFISSRSLRPFKVKLQAKARILWIHDDINVPFLKGEYPVSLPIDRVFAISNWQMNEWTRHFNMLPDRFFLTRNGVDLSMFQPSRNRNRYRLIYVSRPDRGLEVLLKLFPYIRRKVPDAELHIYTYYLPDDKSDNSIRHMVQQPGVFVRGSLSKADLAAEMAIARLMVYPSTWRETSCIAAIESQASGTPVVTGTLAALPETVIHNVSGYLIPGDPHTPEFGHHFVETVVDLMNNDTKWQYLSHGARTRCEQLYDWSVIAKEWLRELQRLIGIRKGIL